MGGRYIEDIRHADDTTHCIVIGRNDGQLRKALKESAMFVLKPNLTKTNLMVMGQKVNKIFGQVQVFNYLGSYICTEGGCSDDIDNV